MERLLLQLSEGISDVDHDLVVARLRMVAHPPRAFLLDSTIVTPRVPSPRRAGILTSRVRGPRDIPRVEGPKEALRGRPAGALTLTLTPTITLTPTLTLAVTRQVLGYFFGTTTTMALLICFFSLMAAMHANIHDQKSSDRL